MADKLSEKNEATDVRVILTKGGRNFWEKAQEYDEESWKKCNHCVAKSSTPCDFLEMEHCTEGLKD